MASNQKKVTVTMVALVAVVIAAVSLSLFVMQRMADDNQHSTETSQQALTASEITKRVISKMDYKDLKELDSGNISAHFVVPGECVTQTSVYISDSTDSAFEIACFKLKNEKSFEELNKAIADHISTKAKGFKDAPNELSLIENYVISNHDGFVFVAVSETASVAASVFADIVDGK